MLWLGKLISLKIKKEGGGCEFFETKLKVKGTQQKKSYTTEISKFLWQLPFLTGNGGSGGFTNFSSQFHIAPL